MKQTTNQNFHSELSNTTIAIRTPSYLPPEQMARNPKFNSNIYVLFILCVEALTGIPSFQITYNLDNNKTSWHNQVQVSHKLAKT